MESLAESELSEELRRDIINTNLALQGIIQDLYECEKGLDKVRELNKEGQRLLSEYRERLSALDQIAIEGDLQVETNSYRQQYMKNVELFRKANVEAMLAIERSDREELLQESQLDTLRRRQKKDKASLVKKSSGITEQLLSISRSLADTNNRSADTLSTLASSSTNVLAGQSELLETEGVISQSGKLLAKYSRRQFTDQLIIILGFLFFVACVIYIIRKRLF